MQTIELQGVLFSFPINGRLIQDWKGFVFPPKLETDVTTPKSVGTEMYIDESEFINTVLRQQKVTAKQAGYINDIVGDITTHGQEYSRLTLFRGVKSFWGFRDLKLGDCYTDLGFSSKTNDFKAALQFTWEKACCFCVINYPRGTRQYQPEYNTEHEFLTYPGERFRLLDVGELVDHETQVYYLEFVDWIGGGPGTWIEPNIHVNEKILHEIPDDSVLVGIYKGKFVLFGAGSTEIERKMFTDYFGIYAFPIVWLIRDWSRLFTAKSLEYTFESYGMLITKIHDTGMADVPDDVIRTPQMWINGSKIRENPIIANAKTLVSLRADGVVVPLPVEIPTGKN